MAGLSGVLGTDLSGLEAYRSALNAISENISNANTTGYAVRNTSLATRYEGADQAVGTGVTVTGVNRSVSNFADTRLRAANSQQGKADTLVNALSTLQSNFSSSGGISAALNQFFSDAKAVGSNPSDIPTRQTLVSDTQQLAGTLNTAAGNITDSINGLSQQGKSLTQETNQLLNNLAQINQSLRSRTGGNTNALLDQQSAALQSLSQLVGANVIRHSNGTVRVGVQGQVLLDGSGAHALTYDATPGQSPGLKLANGHPVPAASSGGKLAGVLSASAQATAQLQQVNRFATVTANAINSQQAQGLSLKGEQGSPLLSLPTPSIIPQSSNSGTETLTAQLKNPNQLPSNGGPFQLKYEGGHWQATNETSGKTQDVGSGNTLSFDGVQVKVSGGAPADGDTFKLDPVAGAAASIQATTDDPKDIAAAAPYVSEAGTYGSTGVLDDNNAGSATIKPGTVAASPAPGAATVPAKYFGQSLQIKFTSPTAYDVQTTDGTTVGNGTFSATTGGAVAVNYPGTSSGQTWQMDIQGQPATGDTFTLSPGGAQSGENADAIGSLATSNSVNGQSITATWAQVTANVGTAVQSAQASQTNATASLQSAQQSQSAISGVSLDQQAAQLQQYSQAYQASAKAISSVSQLFQSLLNAA